MFKLLTAIIFSASVMLSGPWGTAKAAPAEAFAAQIEDEDACENMIEEDERHLPVPLAPGDIFPRAVFLHNERLTMELGQKLDIMTNIAMFPETASIRGLVFKSSMPSVATVDAEGVVTARGKGDCKIAVITENGKEAVLELAVYGIDVDNITISRPEESPYAYESITLKADVFPSDASVSRIEWETSDEKVASVDAEGGVLCGLPGVAVITARAFGGKTASIMLVVRERMAEAVVLSPDEYAGKKGESFSLNAEIMPQNATFKTITYSSSNPSVASVDENGTVLFRRRGSAVITASAQNGVAAQYSAVCTKTFSGAHFRQGDHRWGFSREVRKKACLITAFAMLLKNIGIDATPKTAYNAGGTGMDLTKLAKKLPFVSECAVDTQAEYFEEYLNGRTYIKDPSKYAVRAIKDALDRNPEGVIAYFSRGDESHAVVAIGYVEDTIYYSDPGRARSRGFDVPLSGTWVNAGHGMGYSNLSYIVAIDPVR